VKEFQYLITEVTTAVTKMKIKAKSKRKLEAKLKQWLLHYEKGMCSGTFSYTEDWVVSPDGYSAFECLYAYETYGKKEPCREINLLETFLQAKGTLDFQIKLWAEDRAKGWLSRIELMEIIEELKYEQWVFTATENLTRKLHTTTHQERKDFESRYGYHTTL
jgi:hypothetical protein